MVVTKKSLKVQKKIKIEVREDDPRCKHMSKAEAVATEKALKDDRVAVAEYAKSLRDAREAGKALPKAPETQAKPELSLEERSNEMRRLEIEMKTLKGPGTKAKIEELREQILALNEVKKEKVVEEPEKKKKKTK